MLPQYPREFSDENSIPADIATADFNEDGKQDFAIADWGAKQIIIGLDNGNGNGYFYLEYIPIDIFNPLKIIAEDFNADRHADIVFISSNVLPMQSGILYDDKITQIGTQALALHYLEGNGAGGFSEVISSETVYNPEDIASGFINNDPYKDIAIVDTESGKVQFLLFNNLTKQFDKLNEITFFWPTAITLGDFTSDGKIDALLGARTETWSNTVDIIMLSNLDNVPISIVKQHSVSKRDILDLHISDIDDDGKSELLFSNDAPASVSIINRIDSTLFNNAPFWIAGNAGSIRIAGGDVNADGLKDILTWNIDYNFEYYKNTGTGFVSAAVSNLGLKKVFSIMMENFDTDNNEELVISNSDTPSPQILLAKANPSGEFYINDQINIEDDAYLIEGDLDYDKDNDFVAILDTQYPPQNYGKILVFKNDKTGTINQIQSITIGFATGLAGSLGYFNIGDYYLDLATPCWDRTNSKYYICIFYGQGDGTFNENYVSYSINTFPISIAAGDFNNDMLSDIAYVDYYSNKINIRYNNQGAFPDNDDISLFSFNPWKVYTADINLDKLSDLLVVEDRIPLITMPIYGIESQSIVAFLSSKDTFTGNYYFRKDSDYTVSDNPIEIAIEDFNNDGRNDLAVSHRSNEKTNDPQAITFLFNYYPYPRIDDIEPSNVICTPAIAEPLTINGANFQSPSVFINDFPVEVIDSTPTKIHTSITIPNEVSTSAFLKVINYFYGYYFEDVWTQPITIAIKSVIDSATPNSIPRSGGVTIKVTGADFIPDITTVTIEAQLSDGQPWIVQVEPSIDPSGKMLTFIAPEAPEILIASICVQNNGCKKSCLYESLGYYDQSINQYPFTPQIGITSGFTPVTFYVPEGVFCSAKFDNSYGITKSNQNGQLVVLTPTHPHDYVTVSLCKCFSAAICTPLTTEYEYATFAYVTGSTANLEVIDTDEVKLVDFNPFVIGVQSQLALREAARASVFSPASAIKLPYQIAGRYAFVIMGERVAKIDTGSSEIIAVSPPFRPPYPLTRVYYKDVDITLLDGSNIIVVASDYLFDWPQSQGGLLTFSADEVDGELKLIDYYFVPDFPDTSTVNLKMVGNKAYISALKSSDGPPYSQMILEAQISNEGYISNVVVYTTNHILNDLQGIYTIGEDWLEQSCGADQFYKALYYVIPDENDIDLLNFGTCQCVKPNVGQWLSSPQDVTVAYIEYPKGSGIFDWKAFVINRGSDLWLRINNLCEAASIGELNIIGGKTPVDSDIRSNKDRIFVVNMFSTGDIEYDVSTIDPGEDLIISGISNIPDGFFPRNIAIQQVIEAGQYLDAAKTTIEMMQDNDFTTPSKRQVLLNKLDVIEHLFDTPANEQAIISNTKAFENQVEKFVVNETREKELLIYAEGVIAYVEQ